MAGQPFAPSYRDCNADRDTGWCRPDLIGNYHVSDPSQFGWFATTSVPLPPNGQIACHSAVEYAAPDTPARRGLAVVIAMGLQAA